MGLWERGRERDRMQAGWAGCEEKKKKDFSFVISNFKNKIRYAPYVSLRSQISHIAINKG